MVTLSKNPLDSLEEPQSKNHLMPKNPQQCQSGPPLWQKSILQGNQRGYIASWGNWSMPPQLPFYSLIQLPDVSNIILLGKNATHKESPWGNSHPRAGLNGRYEVAQEEREFRPGLSGSVGNLVKGRCCLLGMAPFSKWWDLRINWPLIYKMAALLFYHYTIFL
jgi:hypothetical protein